MSSCRVLVHRDGTTCSTPASHIVTNRVAFNPLTLRACADHARRYNPAHWTTEPINPDKEPAR